MGQSTAVLLLDDGELDDVQAILDDSGISYGRVRGGAIVPNTPAPRRLLVTTPRRIGAVQFSEAETAELMRIVVVNEDSPTLRAHLREVGFDYLVRRPVHGEALRLLLFHCIYQGEERRSEPRLPVGFEISFRTGLLRRKAVLADLSTRGCRILSRWPIEPGKHIRVTIPESAGLSAPIALKGRVVRIGLDERLEPEGPYFAAVAFDPVPEKAHQELEGILAQRARGPATLHPDDDADAAREGLDAPETSDADGMMHGLSVEVDVRMDAETAHPITEPLLAPLHEAVAPRAPERAESPAPPTEPFEVTPPVVSAPAVGSTPPESAETPESPEDERRGAQRRAYPVRVPAFGDRAMRVLVARDLSVGGMRIESDGGLGIGDRLHLAIYGNANEEPLLVWGTVHRDDGAGGMAIVFDEVHPVIGEQLEKVVAGLPAVESLHDDEAAAMGTVVTEILES
jgi:hypothetical protein